MIVWKRMRGEQLVGECSVAEVGNDSVEKKEGRAAGREVFSC